MGRSLLRFLLKISKRLASSWRRSEEVGTTEPAAGGENVAILLFLLKKIEASLIVAPPTRPPTRYPLTSDRVRIGRDPRWTSSSSTRR